MWYNRNWSSLHLAQRKKIYNKNGRQMTEVGDDEEESVLTRAVSHITGNVKDDILEWS